MEYFLGQIILFAGGFAPKNWRICNGELLLIKNNQPLYSLLGTTYGGDGKTTFALPDLRDRVPIHVGTGKGLTPRNLGDTGGQQAVALSEAELPNHVHEILSANAAGPLTTPKDVEIAKFANGFSSTGSDTMAAGAIEGDGAGSAHENMQPYVALNYIICINGIVASHT